MLSGMTLGAVWRVRLEIALGAPSLSGMVGSVPASQPATDN
jgi:hypothetical protein